MVRWQLLGKCLWVRLHLMLRNLTRHPHLPSVYIISKQSISVHSPPSSRTQFEEKMEASVNAANNGAVVGAVQHAISKFGSVEGRASRSEYWYFALVVTVGTALAAFLDSILGTEWWMLQDGRLVPYFGHLQFLVLLVTIVPMVTVGARRLHDIGKSGWCQLLLFVPVLGWALLIYWMCLAGPRNENAYGSEPLYFV